MTHVCTCTQCNCADALIKSSSFVTDAVYRVIIDPPGGIVANVTASDCNGESCYYTYISNTLTDTSTVNVDVVGCTITRLDSRNISTCKTVKLHLYILCVHVCVFG